VNHPIPTFRPSLAALACALMAVAGTTRAETLYALTNTNQLITLDSAAPTEGSAVSVTGLKSVNERLLGLDARPSTGLLYSLSSLGNLYTVDASNGAASFVARLNVALQGSNFGFDFNPVPDLGQTAASLRVIGNTGTSLAVNANPVSAGQVTVSPGLNEGGVATTASVVSVAYANNDRDAATGTTLYGIDARGDRLYTIVPGTGAMTLKGALGVDTIGVSGFDISYTGQAFAALTDDTGFSGLYTGHRRGHVHRGLRHRWHGAAGAGGGPDGRPGAGAVQPADGRDLSAGPGVAACACSPTPGRLGEGLSGQGAALGWCLF